MHPPFPLRLYSRLLAVLYMGLERDLCPGRLLVELYLHAAQYGTNTVHYLPNASRQSQQGTGTHVRDVIPTPERELAVSELFGLLVCYVGF